MIRKKKLILSCVLWIVSIGVYASDFSAVNDNGVEIYYNILSSTDKTCEVTSGGGSSYTGSVSIPSSVLLDGNTYAVTSIGSYAFSGCSGLASVTIPNSVKSIGDNAFYGCSGLTSVTIPNSVTSIGSYAFSSCSGLTSVTIPNSVTSIGEWAFSYCSGLTSVTIPNSVTSIGSYAFANCSGLTSVTIPNSVTSIGDGAFSGCSGLTSVKVESGNTVYDSRDNCNAIIETKSNTLIRGCKNTTIPNSVTSIGDGAFDGCSGLTSVTIPNSVTKIGSYAFYGCSGLTSVTIPNSVTSIGDGAFSGCSGLTSIKVESGNTVYDSRDNCNAIIETKSNTLISGCKNTTIPNSMTSIGDYAFSSCSGLTSVTIPNSVTKIGSYAFYGCSGLTSIIVEIITPLTIQEKTFTEFEKPTLYVPASALEAYKSHAQWGQFKNIQTIQGAGIPNNEIWYEANAKLAETTSTYSSGLHTNAFNATIKSHTFSNGKGIITFNAAVTSIGERAFFSCSGLTSVTIPNSVTKIGFYAYGDCSGLTSLTIPNSVTSIGSPAFSGCSGLTSIKVESGNTVYDSRDNCNAIIKTKSNTLISGCKNTTIPNSVTSIGIEAFYGCSGLTSVTIPNSVTEIGDGAFECCSGLTSVTIPNSVTSIGNSAFRGCSGLTSVTIPNSVTSIGRYAFSGCSGLTSIKVESGNTVYDSRDNCNAIIETKSNTLISGCKNTTIPNSVTSIGDDAFSSCSGLTSVTIPNSVTSIGYFAFNGCSGLTSVTIPNSVTSIGDGAFNGCSGLTSITVEAITPPSIRGKTFEYFEKPTLYVPASALEAYKSHAQWGQFKNIQAIQGETPQVGTKFEVNGVAYSILSIGDKNEVEVISKTPAYSGSVTIPAEVTYQDAKYNVVQIGYCAFQNCEIGVMALPYTIRKLDKAAFGGCSMPKLTVLANTPPELYCDFDSQQYDNLEVVVNDNALLSYMNDQYWGKFKNLHGTTVYSADEAWEKLSEKATELERHIKDIEDYAKFYHYLEGYMLQSATAQQRHGIQLIGEAVDECAYGINQTKLNLQEYMQGVRKDIYAASSANQLTLIVVEAEEYLDKVGQDLSDYDAQIEDVLAGFKSTYAELIISIAQTAVNSLESEIAAIAAVCVNLRDQYNALKAQCGTSVGMIDPVILNDPVVMKYEKDLYATIKYLEASSENYAKLVSGTLPTSVDDVFTLARKMYDLERDIENTEARCADLYDRYDEVEKIVKSGKLVEGKTDHQWRVSNRTDITVDFASIEEADASDMVVDGDTLYLERGTSLENQTFKKRLVIVGPGYKYDKAGQDASVGDLYAYGEGAEIIGLYVPRTISVNANNLIIRNCHLGNVSGTGTSYENENCLIHSCFIDGVIEGAGADNTDAWELSNNIFAEGAITNLDNAVLDHNTFVVSSADWCLRDVTNSVVKNNILFHKRVNPLLDCSGNTYEKNIFSTDQKLDNNEWCETLGKIIECTGDPSKEAYYQTFKDGYAREYSTDGSDCGAFGGSDPYVKGGKTGEYKSRGGEEEILSGQCGVNEKNVIEWRIDKSTGTLYLEGSGRMASYDDPKDVPWYTSAELIRHIVFDNSIIEIGAYAFSQLPNLNEAITLPGQLKAIGRGAFSGTPITSVTFEQPLDSIGYEAFLGTNLSTLYMNTVWLPYGFSSSSVRGGSGKLTVYVPKGQLERYRSHHWDSSWTDYYTLAESDYDCQWDEYYNDLEQLSGLLSDLRSLASTLSIDAGEKSMVSLFVRNSLLSDAEKEMRVADIVKRQEDIEEWWMESEDDCKRTFDIVEYSWNNADWNRHLGQYIWGGKCVALLENLTGFRKRMEEYIKCFGVDASYKGIGGTCGTGGNEKNVTWSLDGINGILTVTGTGAMQKGLWDYWKSALIKHVILPDGITSIDKDAFVDFKVMESLTCSATAVPKLSNNVFSNTEYDTTGTLYVPSAALELYRTATYWKDWANIRTLESDPDFPGWEMAAGTLDEKATLDIEHDVYNSLGIFIQALASRGIAAESNISVASQTFSLIINSQSYTWIEQAAQALESTAKYFYMTSNGGAVFRLTFSDAFTQLYQGDMAAVLATVQSLCSHIITSGITIYIDGNSYTYDGFQVEPNDLLSLKNLYERFGGTQWHSSYQWSFASNGRNAADFPGVTFTEPDKLGYSSVKAIHLGKVGLKGDVTDWVLYLPELVSLDLSVGELQGDLTGFVSHLTKLKSLDVSYNQLTGLTHLPSSVTSLYKEGQFMYNAEGALNALQPVKVYISDRQTQNLPSILTYSLASNSCRPSTLYIMERDNTLAGDYYGTLVPESNTDNVYGTKWVSTPYIYTYGQEHDIYLRSSDHCLYPAKLVYESGDANMSGYTDVLDVQTTITDILNPAMVPLFNKSAADTYGDSRINVQDIVCMVNIVLRNQQPEQDDATKANARARTGNTVNVLYTEGEGLFVTTDTPLGAIDVELTGVSSHEVGLMLNRRDFQLISLDTEGGSRHVLFSPSGKAIPVGTTQLLRLSTASAEPVYATLSSLDATLVDAAIGLRPTGMDGPTSNLSITLRMQDGNLGVTASQTLSNVELRVMTLDGVDVYVQHLSTLQAGTTLFQTELPKGLYVTTLASADSHTVNVKLINK